MTEILVAAVAVVVGFVTGVLVGRKHQAQVAKVVDTAEKL